ncbi:UNVERIFIED_ORG: hypothetical protein B2H98_18755 [Clostridium botulinum]|uniref:Uncharacterized protein n=1 Tax=Clostridium botulinum (strain Eklund 17B / Type B) TaxID=935198 RepID=B2TRZ0_CLOBB|nr:hypothetical protein [Clostridium botulinum]ACD25055.1 hypothetical protein CLL_A2282 [Clostridium botulinum B str. Eklund 17B (NRP)]MBN1035795.1 hypothetical protein [Clostridium botulinum]MBN1042333.1 hypothetical protein [Clostridium botulinum]MBY6930982.1 hypothetical protein [Clostridium botulinum]MBY6975802.1 hypothetical protein [Clostridium botulinum]
MSNISSKYTHLMAAELLIDSQNNTNDKIHNGILLLTNFGFVYGKIQNVDQNNTTSVANLLLTTRSKINENYIKDGNKLTNDGSVIVLNDAVVKYSNNITLNMKEIIIFVDQIVGYYPVDLSSLDPQLI